MHQVFVALYHEGLIYRGYFMVNRCPRCQTVLSDLEVEHKDVHGQALATSATRCAAARSDSVVVATTRPETMLGDTAVAVHPEDERYRHLDRAGARFCRCMDRPIPVIADERRRAEFGTGAVKVTPGPRPNDFEIGKKHDLEQIIVIDERGRA